MTCIIMQMMVVPWKKWLLHLIVFYLNIFKFIFCVYIPLMLSIVCFVLEVFLLQTLFCLNRFVCGSDNSIHFIIIDKLFAFLDLC